MKKITTISLENFNKMFETMQNTLMGTENSIECVIAKCIMCFKIWGDAEREFHGIDFDTYKAFEHTMNKMRSGQLEVEIEIPEEEKKYWMAHTDKLLEELDKAKAKYRNPKMRIVYKPTGAAGEYAKYAANLYIGCPNGCTYCYLKRGPQSKVLGGNTPTLRKGYGSIEEELEDFKKDLDENLNLLCSEGVFFSFATDPMLDDTYKATIQAARMCGERQIPVTILTKCVQHFDEFCHELKEYRQLMKLGVTLTGYDDMEPNASKNGERLNMIREAKEAGFGTFVSLEPVIDISMSNAWAKKAINYIDELRIGLKTPVGAYRYPIADFALFTLGMMSLCDLHKVNLQFKQSYKKLAEKYEIKL